MSADARPGLPWDALQNADGPIPWPAVDQFVEALVASPAVWEELRRAYEAFLQSPYDGGFEAVYVPGIAALAGPRLDEQTRRQIGDYLLTALDRAGQEQDEFATHVLATAYRALGLEGLPARWAGAVESGGRPLRVWLAERWQHLRDWYAQTAAEVDAGVHAQLDALVDRFLQSPMGAAVAEADREAARLVARGVCRCAYEDVGALPEHFDKMVLREVLVDRLPHHLRGGADLYAKVVPVTKALLAWLGAEGIVADTDAMIEAVESWAERIQAGALPPEETDGFEEYAGADDRRERATRRKQGRTDEPARPVDKAARSKVGRNDPCPCGSGRKYKKCCGRGTLR